MDWHRFLVEYSHELQARAQHLNWALDRANVPQSARDAEWFGFDPASESAICETETRLAVRLPEDLKAFYLVTNGWMFCSTQVHDIKPVQSLGYLSKSDPELYSLCDGFINPSTTDIDLLECRYFDEIKVLRSIVLNTSGDDATLLFDPENELPFEELRYGTWAAWHPGMAWSTRTFEDFLRQERNKLLSWAG